ncbi:SCO4225 family membrane protein [Kitasatospora sp. NPDC059571]|uniref:SCO4225 family membrane protein n=1 Tax=Kitasatospora sp. NPDC059571 TaxID=3346871 RepID=UPI00368297CE
MSRSADARVNRLAALLRPAFDNLLSRAYLGLVVVAIAVFLHAAYVARDTSFAGMWPVLATAPFGVLALPLPALVWDSPLEWCGPLLLTAATTAAGLANAVMIGRFARTLRRRTRHG